MTSKRQPNQQKKQSNRFSNTWVEKLPFAPDGVRRVVWYDLEIPKLALFVGRTSKVFYVVANLSRGGLQSKVGRFGEIDVIEARELAKQIIANLADPAADPAAVKRRIKLEHAEVKNSDTASLGALCRAYVVHLEASGKAKLVAMNQPDKVSTRKRVRADGTVTPDTKSARDVDSAFRNHVYPKQIAKKLARDVTAEEVADILRPLTTAGKRQAAKHLRSYLKSAYMLASQVSTDTAIDGKFKVFRCTSNPVASVATVKDADNARERALSLTELHDYYDAVLALKSETIRDALLACLLLGGQRGTQVLRITGRDVADDTVTIWDGKGKRQKAREHLLPLFGQVKEIIGRRVIPSMPDSLIFWGRGAPCEQTTLSHTVRDISKAFIKADPKRQPFGFSDIRRTVKTLLVAHGVDEGILDQLQSHNLTGVSLKHYNKYKYLPEKQQALEAWFALVNKRRDRRKKAATDDGAPSVDYNDLMKRVKAKRGK